MILDSGSLPPFRVRSVGSDRRTSRSIRPTPCITGVRVLPRMVGAEGPEGNRQGLIWVGLCSRSSGLMTRRFVL